MLSEDGDGEDQGKVSLEEERDPKSPDIVLPSEKPMSWLTYLALCLGNMGKPFQKQPLRADWAQNPHHPSNARKYDRCDDKRQGYPRLAAWIASDPNFAIARDYSDLRVRCRLQKGFKIEKLKAELDDMDEEAAEDDPANLGSIGDDLNTLGDSSDGQSARDKLMDKISKELKEYDDIMLRELQFRAVPRPAKRNFSSLLNYLFISNDIKKVERLPFYYEDEMLSLAAGRDHSWMDHKLEALLEWIPRSQKVFTKGRYRTRSKKDVTHHFSPDRIEMLSKAVTIIFASIFIALPVGILAGLSKSQIAGLAIVIGFVVAFPIYLAGCSRLKQQEVFAVAAAYAAVLVVFLNNLQQSNGNCTCRPQ